MSKFIKTTLLGASAVVALSACASTGRPQLAPAGAYEVGSMSLNLRSDWNAVPIKTGKSQKAMLLTKDGADLNSVYVFYDLQEGDSLLRQPRKEQPVPKFYADLSDLEMVEFVMDSLAKGKGYTGLKTAKITPETFKGEDAIAFELMGLTSNGLEVEGRALVSIIDGLANIILFVAPSEYYADKDQADIESIFESVSSGAAIG